MSANAIDRRFNIEELEFLIETLESIIKRCDIKGSSLLIENLPKIKQILKHFVEYKTRLEKYITECQNNINPDGFKDWYVHDNELFLQATIGIIMPLEDYYVLYYYLDDAKLTKNSYVNNKIISLRNELAKEIANSSSWRYLCNHGIKKNIK